MNIGDLRVRSSLSIFLVRTRGGASWRTSSSALSTAAGCVPWLALNPRCRRRERFLVLTSLHRVERLLSSWYGKTQIARIEENGMAIVAVGNSVGRPDEIREASNFDLRWLQVFAYCTIPQLRTPAWEEAEGRLMKRLSQTFLSLHAQSQCSPLSEIGWRRLTLRRRCRLRTRTSVEPPYCLMALTKRYSRTERVPEYTHWETNE